VSIHSNIALLNAIKTIVLPEIDGIFVFSRTCIHVSQRRGSCLRTPLQGRWPKIFTDSISVAQIAFEMRISLAAGQAVSADGKAAKLYKEKYI